jgi:hypothetical protein
VSVLSSVIMPGSVVIGPVTVITALPLDESRLFVMSRIDPVTVALSDARCTAPSLPRPIPLITNDSPMVRKGRIRAAPRLSSELPTLRHDARITLGPSGTATYRQSWRGS